MSDFHDPYPSDSYGGKSADYQDSYPSGARKGKGKGKGKGKKGGKKGYSSKDRDHYGAPPQYLDGPAPGRYNDEDPLSGDEQPGRYNSNAGYNKNYGERDKDNRTYGKDQHGYGSKGSYNGGGGKMSSKDGFYAAGDKDNYYAGKGGGSSGSGPNKGGSSGGYNDYNSYNKSSSKGSASPNAGRLQPGGYDNGASSPSARAGGHREKYNHDDRSMVGPFGAHTPFTSDLDTSRDYGNAPAAPQQPVYSKSDMKGYYMRKGEKDGKGIGAAAPGAGGPGAFPKGGGGGGYGGAYSSSYGVGDQNGRSDGAGVAGPQDVSPGATSSFAARKGAAAKAAAAERSFSPSARRGGGKPGEPGAGASSSGAPIAPVRTEDEKKAILRKIKGVLNKLSPQKFDSLAAQLREVVTTQDDVETFATQVFDKVVRQHGFLDLYTDMCVDLNKHCQEGGIPGVDPRIFRSILLNTCQQNFEKYCSEPDFQLSKEGDAPLPVEQTSGLEKSAFEIETEYKKCMSGTVKFVAKLIVEEILASKMVVLLAESLLENEHPVRLENLAVFLKIVGPVFDREEWPYHKDLKALFFQLMDIANRTESKKLRFCIMNLMDTRKNDWKEIVVQS